MAMYSTLISTADLAAHLDDPAFVVIDVRHDLAQPDSWGETEYRRTHVLGARFVHFERDLAGAKSGTNGRHPLPETDTCAALFGRLGIDATKQVVVYDQGGTMYAARCWWMLRWLGHKAVAVLDGGYAVWIREGRPVTAAIPVFIPATFTARDVEATVDAATVAASLASRSLFLVDARGRERFRGDAEPLDPVAGHIPGAVNRPYTQNFKSDGTYKPASELRTEWDALVAGHGDSEIVHYCGSGVSACHNVLAMEHAGLGRTRLYPGSWSEWCADPLRPTGRGDA